MEPLRVLLIGNGGREHALAWKLNQSPQGKWPLFSLFIAEYSCASLVTFSLARILHITYAVEAIYVAPGNGGTAQIGPKVLNVHVKSGDFKNLVSEARKRDVNLVVPGPEQPLVDGIVDFFRSRLPARVRIFGPSSHAATLEGSKTFSKDFMKRHNIPTAIYENFKDYVAARNYVDFVNHSIVIKATGLAAGKGVVLPETKAEAHKELKEMMLDKKFNAAGDEVVTAGQMKLRNGAPVTVNNSVQPSNDSNPTPPNRSSC